MQEEQSREEINEEIKQKMKNFFIDELLRRYAITSTLEMAQGTVGPMIKYPPDDIVVSPTVLLSKHD